MSFSLPDLVGVTFWSNSHVHFPLAFNPLSIDKAHLLARIRERSERWGIPIKGNHVPLNSSILNTKTKLVMFTELISASFMCVLSLILHPSQQDIYIDNFPSAPSSDQTKIRDEELKLSNDGRLKGLLWRLGGCNPLSPSSGTQRESAQPAPLTCK